MEGFCKKKKKREKTVTFSNLVNFTEDCQKRRSSVKLECHPTRGLEFLNQSWNSASRTPDRYRMSIYKVLLTEVSFILSISCRSNKN